MLDTTLEGGAIRAASEVLDALRALPTAAHVIAGGGLFAGILLWAFGQRLMRFATGAAGTFVGAMGGYFLLPALGVGAWLSIPSPLLGAIVGGTGGLLVGVLFHRAGVAIAGAGVLSIVGGLVLGILSQYWSGAPPEGEAPLDGERLLLDGPFTEDGGEVDFLFREGHEGDVEGRDGGSGSESVEGDLAAGDRIRRFLGAVGDEARLWWGRQAGSVRVWTVIGATGGGLVGFLLGLGSPKRASRLVTSMVGGAIGIASGAWLLGLSGISLPGSSGSPSVLLWAGLWGVATLAGMLVQGRLSRRGDRVGV